MFRFMSLFRFLALWFWIIAILSISSAAAFAAEKLAPAGSKQGPEILCNWDRGSVSTVAFSPDGKYVVTGSDDLTVKLWDVASGREIRTFRGHAAKITAVGVSSDGDGRLG